MARYLVATRRGLRGSDDVPTALDAVRTEPGIRIVAETDPQMVTIEASATDADRLRAKLSKTHFVEAEVHRSLH